MKNVHGLFKHIHRCKNRKENRNYFTYSDKLNYIKNDCCNLYRQEKNHLHIYYTCKFNLIF